MNNIRDTTIPLMDCLLQLKSYKDINEDTLGFINAYVIRLYAEYYQSNDDDMNMITALECARFQLNGAIDMIMDEEQQQP